MTILQLFWSTVSFLTILPVPTSNKILPQEEFSKGILFYTLIGLLVGLIDYICYGAIVFFFKMPLIGAVFAVLSETIVTGGFHLDGLADTCDGFFSARKKEKMIEIMKDSRVGTNGALALLFDILLKIVFLVSMTESDGYLAVLLAPVAGKMATPILMKSNYAKEQSGLGSLYLTQKYTKYMIAAVLIGIALLAGFLQMKSILPIITVLLFGFLFREYCQHKIGGMTGDTLGAGYELSEIVFLAVMTLQGGIV
ncbi:Adenosylcobinamide-GDP ribazoletransferase [Clostridium sp. MD294]|nr:Adenosylcobinamide-GDP ribazoletransferase [Clostridium sp. MD294]